MKAASTLSVLGAVAAAGAAGSKPNILFVLQDDYGWNDVGFHSEKAEPFTPSITKIAKDDGMVLDRHYVFWYCSPTRRSFLSGRNPMHHGTKLSGASDDMDLRWTWISEKLASAGYTSYWYGKGHTGYLSTNHLPIAHNFSDHYGYLTGAQDYQNAPRWLNDMPASDSWEYSTDAYGAAALKVAQMHDPASPFFLYLPWQAVHSPYDLPTDTSLGACPESNSTIMQMICDADAWMGKIVQTLKERGLWENTLMVYSADNGGIGDGNNYPLRGEKATDFDGGFRVNAFVAGGVVPPALRGTASQALVHITDWYPTLCHLAGVDPTDEPAVPPLPYDPEHPEIDIWGEESYPGLDGKNAWEALTTPGAEFNAVRDRLILSQGSMIMGKYKLVTGMSQRVTFGPSSHLSALMDEDSLSAGPGPHPGHDQHTGWRMEDGTWTKASEADFGCVRSLANKTVPPTPCLFDIVSDPEERADLSEAEPEIVASMVKALQLAWATNFTGRSPTSMLGPCNQTCATEYYGGSSNPRGKLIPICGVPGCSESLSLLV